MPRIGRRLWQIEIRGSAGGVIAQEEATLSGRQSIPFRSKPFDLIIQWSARWIFHIVASKANDQQQSCERSDSLDGASPGLEER
jgi:hypothetical protein